jgi:hypothetical protein
MGYIDWTGGVNYGSFGLFTSVSCRLTNGQTQPRAECPLPARRRSDADMRLSTQSSHRISRVVSGIAKRFRRLPYVNQRISGNLPAAGLRQIGPFTSAWPGAKVPPLVAKVLSED